LSASLLYKVSAVLLILFAIGHTIGFRQVDPRWNADGVVSGMRSVSFEVQGFRRSYWDFYAGFGFFVSVLLVFAAVLAWQLGSMPREALAAIPVIRWSFAICFIVTTALTWRYFFVAPGMFSSLVALGLLGAAWAGA
jgi:hypothetical protein